MPAGAAPRHARWRGRGSSPRVAERPRDALHGGRERHGGIRHRALRAVQRPLSTSRYHAVSSPKDAATRKPSRIRRRMTRSIVIEGRAPGRRRPRQGEAATAARRSRHSTREGPYKVLLRRRLPTVSAIERAVEERAAHDRTRRTKHRKRRRCLGSTTPAAGRDHVVFFFFCASTRSVWSCWHYSPTSSNPLSGHPPFNSTRNNKARRPPSKREPKPISFN